MSKKRYEVKNSCPQCGCSAVNHLSEEEIKERFGDVPNVELECGECMVKYQAPVKDVCPEWDKECQLKNQ